MTFDSHHSSSTGGLTNARTRLVGARTGLLADVVVAIVRSLRGVKRVAARVAVRAADVVTPLGWFWPSEKW